MKIIALALLFAAIVGAADFPPDARVVDVRAAPYLAKGDGIADDTDAIQRAIHDHLDGGRFIYLRDGTYKVSRRLQWRHADEHGWSAGWGAYLVLQGQSRDKTVIKLTDGAEGFGNAADPRAVLFTASRDDANAYDDASGPGNQAFGNSIRDLTVDVGAGNPGAVGIDWQVSNWGSLRDVLVRGPADGAIGIRVDRRDNGPGLLQRVEVSGFRTALLAGDSPYHLTMEHIVLRGQSEQGLRIHGLPVSIRDLRSSSTVPAVVASGLTLVDLLGARLDGGAPAAAAVVVRDDGAQVVAHDLRITGYGRAIDDRGKPVMGPKIDLWISGGPVTGPAKTLGLKVRETPVPSAVPMERWVVGGTPDVPDATAALQAALDSGKPVVYLPSGRWRLTGPLTIPATVLRIVGVFATFNLADGHHFTRDQAVLRVVGDTAEPLVIDDIRIECGGVPGLVGVEHASRRPLAVRCSPLNAEGVGLRSQPGAGPLFLEDVVADLDLRGDAPLWARQLDTENSAGVVTAAGGDLWILGWKQEATHPCFDLRGTTRLELWGGALYAVGSWQDRAQPMMTLGAKAIAQVSTTGVCFVPSGMAPVLVRREGGPEITRAQARWRGEGFNLPFATLP